MIDLTATDLTIKTAVELRKIGAECGVKGASKGKKADLLAALIPLQDSQRAAKAKEIQDKLDAAKALLAPSRPAKSCPICGIRNKYQGARQGGEKAPRGSEMCDPCFEEGGWENTHSDSDHDSILATPEADRTADQISEIDGCWICHPELNLAKRAPREGRSRAGMVIVARGTEVHKSTTFKSVAEAAGWSVIIGVEGKDRDARYVATASKGSNVIQLSWEGRAYDYPNSSATINGRSRKVRNLKEALRLI